MFLFDFVVSESGHSLADTTYTSAVGEVGKVGGSSTSQHMLPTPLPPNGVNSINLLWASGRCFAVMFLFESQRWGEIGASRHLMPNTLQSSLAGLLYYV